MGGKPKFEKRIADSKVDPTKTDNIQKTAERANTPKQKKE
jgi:hypothetical protein